MRTLVLAIVAFTAACDMPWAVEMEVQITNLPAAYQQWFDEVGRCMGEANRVGAGRFSRIGWYSSPSIHHRESGAKALGLWTEPHKITLHADFLEDASVVKHELVHDLLGSGTHGSEFFEVCAR